MKQKSKTLDNELKKVEISEKEMISREKSLQELKRFEKERDELKAKINLMKDCDPELFTQMENDCVVSKEAINRWTGYPFLFVYYLIMKKVENILLNVMLYLLYDSTDNVFQIKSWCKRKFSLEDSVVNKQFGIPEDFDYQE